PLIPLVNRSFTQTNVIDAASPSVWIDGILTRNPSGTSNNLDAANTSRREMLVPITMSMTSAPTAEDVDALQAGFEGGDIEAVVSCERDLGIPSGSSKGVDFESHQLNSSKQIVLRTGSMLFAPSVNTVVDTPFGRISIDTGSLVLVIVNSRALTIYDLHDSQRNAVVVSVANRTLALSPGRHATVTSGDVKAFEEVNPAEAFGYRNMTSKQLCAGLNLFASEFSITTAMRMVRPLRHLAASRHPHAAQLTSRIMKTAAILMQTGAGSGAYQPIPRARVTAFAP